MWFTSDIEVSHDSKKSRRKCLSVYKTLFCKFSRFQLFESSYGLRFSIEQTVYFHESKSLTSLKTFNLQRSILHWQPRAGFGTASEFKFTQIISQMIYGRKREMKNRRWFTELVLTTIEWSSCSIFPETGFSSQNSGFQRKIIFCNSFSMCEERFC